MFPPPPPPRGGRRLFGGRGGGGRGSSRPSREKQRRDALSRQQTARRDFADHARRVVKKTTTTTTTTTTTPASEGNADFDEEKEGKRTETDDAMATLETKTREEEDDDDSDDDDSDDGGELQLPEYMTDVPKDLREHWLCQPKARGQRCTIIAARGRTSAFDERGKSMRVTKNKKNNKKKNHFQSVLPGGSYGTRGNSETFCILDCVYGEGIVDWNACTDGDAMEEDGGVDIGGYFVVLDVMAWNGAETYGCDVEFRSFWLQSKFASEIDSPGVSRDGHEYPMFPAPMFSCATVEDLRQCYEGARMKSFGGYACDGLLFRDKRASYTPGERTPLALLYKDEALCESCEEGTFRREVLERGCFLKVKGDGSSGELCAADDDTVLVSTRGLQLSPNVAVRSEWEGDRLVPRGTCEKKERRPDAFSAIQFYIACKTNPLTIEEIASCA